VKHGKKTMALCIIAIAVAITIAAPQQALAASDAKKPKATDVQYVTDESGTKTGIKTFTISPYTYYNLSQDSVINKDKDRTLKLNDAKLLQIAKRQIFPKWAVIAEGIFRDQANQLVTIEGSGMMSSSTTASNSFDRQFSTGKVSNGYKYDWSVSDLSQLLSQETSSMKGKTCWDETRVTGVTQIGNLSGARTLMGQELRNCSDDNDISKDEFLGNSHQKNEDKRRLPDLENDKSGDGFANIVTCVNRAGSSGDYDYVTFGLAVYDFDVTPVAAENLKYIEAADENYEVGDKTVSGQDILMGLAGDSVNKTGISFRNDDENGTTSYIRNNTTQEVTQSSGLENSVTEESTISTDDTFEWGMEQEIGVELNFGGFGRGLAPFDGLDAFSAAAPCMFPRATVNISNSWHELWSTTKSKSETQSATKTKTTNAEVTLPGHTIAIVNQSLNNKKTTENYQQPVILNYKVAIFAMSGDYFNGAAGGIENSRYDKQWMSVIFDGSDDYETSGCNALGSLYNRAVINQDTQGYDGAKGKYRSWCDKSAWNSSSKINWGDISSTLSGDSRDSHRIKLGTGKKATTIQELATELPLIEKAQMLTSKRESITSSVDQIIPLYSLNSVDMKSGSKEYDLVLRDTLYLDSIDLEGYDKDGAEFYEFDKSWGEWVLLNEDEEIIEDNGTGDESETEGEITAGALSLINDTRTGSQKVVISELAEGANEEHLLKWRLKPGTGTKITSNEELNRPAGSENPGYMTDEEKEAVETPVVLVNIKDRENDIVNFETEGTYKGPWNEAVNLAHVITADAVDTSGKIRGVSVFWESKGTPGITVDRSGETTFTKKGTYKVRPFSYDMTGKKIVPTDKSGDPVWLEVVAQDKASLSSIVIHKPELTEEDTMLSEGTTALGFDLGSYTQFFDQYGDKWEGTEDAPLPEVRYSVSSQNGATIDGENILTITRPGTYTVSAKAYDADGNDTGITIKSIRITVTEEDRLASITMEEPAMSKSERTLDDQDDCVIVQNLKSLLTYVDQHGDEWTGKKPNVTFTIAGDPRDAEIKGGNFYAYAPGTYTIVPSAESYKINSVTIEILEDTHLVLTSEDPGKQYLYTEDDQIELELERYINATTRYGGRWKGDVPELVFTLEDTNGATIETKTVYDGDEDYEGSERHYFRTSAVGEYFVHVEPKKASAYTESIDDIYIRVVKGKKVARIEFKDIDETTDPNDFMINHYMGQYPSIDLSKYLTYYDGFGELIDPAKDHVKIPDCTYTLEDAEEYSENEYALKGGTFTAYEAQFYFVKATMNVTNYDPYGELEDDTILEATTGFSIYDVDWLHDLGDWEITKEATCTEDGVRVKRCSGGEGCINHEDGICDVEIVDTIPATGHHWNKYYKFSSTDHTLRTYCEKCGAENEEAITSCPGTPDNGWSGSASAGIPNPMSPAECTESGTYRSSGSLVTVPAVGHSWSSDFVTVKEPTCAETGLEVIKCTRRGCNEVREGEKYQRVIPKLSHQPDENGWEYLKDDNGQAFKETCEDYGVKVTHCTGCGIDLYDAIAPTGHDWAEPTYKWTFDTEAGTYVVTATRKCTHNTCEGCVETETASAGKEVTRQPSATEYGETTYTAKFLNPAFETQTKAEDDIEPLGDETSPDIVSDALKERKEAATEELNGYKADVEYEAQQAEERKSAVTAGCNEIRLAKTLEEVDLALANAKAQIDQIRTKEEADAEAAVFADMKASCIQSVEGIDPSDYTESPERQGRIAAAIEAAIAALNAATTEEALNQAQADLITVLLDVLQEEAAEQQSGGGGISEETINEIVALVDSMAMNAKSEIGTYKDPADYRDAEKTALNEKVQEWNDKIDKAATDLKALVLENVENLDSEKIITLFDTAVQSAKSELDQIKTSAQVELEELEELCLVKTDAGMALKRYKEIQDYRAAQQNEIRAIVAEGQLAISNAASAEEIEAALKACEAKLDKVKTDEQLKKEEAAQKAAADINAITPSDVTADKASVSSTIPTIAAAKIITTANISKKTLKVQWTANKAAKNYRVQYRLAGKSAWISKWSAGRNNFTIKSLKKNSLLQVRIAGYAKQNGKWVRGAWSNVQYRYMSTATLKKVEAGKKQMTVTWKKTAGATGYQIQYSLKSNMAGAKTVTVKKGKTTKKVIKKLKKGKKYFVKIRPIKKKAGKTYLGQLSKAKAVKIK